MLFFSLDSSGSKGIKPLKVIPWDRVESIQGVGQQVYKLAPYLLVK